MKILFIFICIFQITIHNLLAQSQTIPSLYIGKIELGPGIDKSKEIKIRNLIILNLIKKYKNSYRVIDDETVKDLLLKLKIKQQIGCDTDVCYQMLDDALNTDFKITASIIQEGNFKFRLNLKLLKIKNLNVYLENSIDRSFSISELDHYVKELSSHLVDSKYVINEKNMDSQKIESVEFIKDKNSTIVNEIDFSKIFDNLKPDLKENNFTYYGKMSSLLLAGIGSFNYLNQYTSFKNESATISPLIFYYQPTLFNDLLPVMAINSINEQKRIDNYFDSLNNSSNLIQTGIGGFGFFYLLSVIDLHLFNNKLKESSTLNLEKGQINFDIKNDTMSKNQSNDLYYQIKYSYEF